MEVALQGGGFLHPFRHTQLQDHAGRGIATNTTCYAHSIIYIVKHIMTILLTNKREIIIVFILSSVKIT